MRYWYTILLYLALPYIFIRLGWRSLRQPDYRQRLAERLGFYPFKLERCIWVHAVSVGEALAAIPLIKSLKARHPDLPLLVTTMTPTGAARLKATLGHDIKLAYLPYDWPDAMQRFLNTMNPVIAIIMETEMWPNLLFACRKRNIPVCLVNARLSARSAKGYHRIAKLTREMLQQIDVIAAHGHMDAERFIQLGAPAERVIVTGNIKFDLEWPAQLIGDSLKWRDNIGKDRFVWMAASTHEGEEDIILAAHAALREEYPNALLILAPRHPDRFETLATQCANTFQVTRRSLAQDCTKDTAIYLADTMGELLFFYNAVDVAFVGGSLIQRGGHNILEPCALGKPVLTGPHLFNFTEISELFLAAQALTVITNVDSLTTALHYFLQYPLERKTMGERAKEVVDANRGALQKQLALIDKAIVSRQGHAI